MTNIPVNYEEIRIRAEQRVRAQIKFLKHLGVFLLINTLLWADWFTKPQKEIPIAATLIWGLILLVHGINVFMRTGLTDKLRSQAFERELELERERMRIGGDVDNDYSSIEEKPKRKNSPLHVRLTDDGELADIDDEDPALTLNDLEKRG